MSSVRFLLGCRFCEHEWSTRPAAQKARKIPIPRVCPSCYKRLKLGGAYFVNVLKSTQPVRLVKRGTPVTIPIASKTSLPERADKSVFETEDEGQVEDLTDAQYRRLAKALDTTTVALLHKDIEWVQRKYRQLVVNRRSHE
jgi:hypothetical protein